MKMQCFYERVPEVPFLVLPSKGKPHQGLLYPYSRKFGFSDLEIDLCKPHTRGGSATVFLVEEEGRFMVSGKATCSMSDNFSYKDGRERALLRATNLGLGHDDLDAGIMYRMTALDKLDDKSKATLLVSLANYAEVKSGLVSNTMYFHPETAEILPKLDGFKVKTSKIILKNHVWIGFEE